MRNWLKMGGAVALIVMVALIATASWAKAASPGIYLNGDVYCAGNGDACCDSVNCGSGCHGTVRGWNSGTFYCDQVETT